MECNISRERQIKLYPTLIKLKLYLSCIARFILKQNGILVNRSKRALRVGESNPGLPRAVCSNGRLLTGGYTDHYTNADLAI